MPDLTSTRSTLPTALRARARWVRLGPSNVPALIAHPSAAGESAPLTIWLHGRTATKELDAGRYLRWIRAGIAACAIDLPGHGERFDPALQSAEATLDVVAQMVDEIDGVVDALLNQPTELGRFDAERLAIGGMSAGGMVTLARLCRPHRFRCATVEATTGSWRWQSHRAMWKPELAAQLNPIDHVGTWRDIPLQAIHARHDEWVALAGQEEFLDAVRHSSSHPDQIELVVYDHTGAPNEHIGFGRRASEAKDAQLAFLKRWLGDNPRPSAER